MRNDLRVQIFGKDVGILAMQENKTIFQYLPEFTKENIEISPIKLRTSNLEPYTNIEDKYFNQLPGVFADSLPDKFGNKIIEKYYANKGVNKYNLTNIQKLAYIGRGGMGALEYIPSTITDEIKEVLEIRHLVSEAREILQGNIEVAIPEIIEAGGSAGGARAKAIIQWNKNTNDIISGRLDYHKDYSQYLIKFDGTANNKSPEDYIKIEYIYMKIAEMCDLNVAHVDFMIDRDYFHLMVKRFDRIKNKKLHIHSLCGMTHTNFNDSGLYSYEEYLATVSLVTQNQRSVEDAYSHMIFNIIASNQDDHTKNFSFVMSEYGEWNISPIYDLTYSHGSGYTSKHQMKVNGKQSDFLIEDLYIVANKSNIKRSDAKLIIDHIQSIFYENFEVMAKGLNVQDDRIKRILSNCRKF